MSMVFILPNERGGLPEVESNLTNFVLKDIQWMKPENYDVSIPK
jgi:hypothetical protein